MRQGLMPVPPPAPSTVSRSMLYLRGEGDRARQVRRPVGAGLEEDVLGAGLAQLLDSLGEGFLGDHADARVPLELLERAALEGLDDCRIGGIGQDDVAALVEHLGLLQCVDLDLAADVLGALAPLQLDALDAELLDGVFLHAQPRVLDVGLDDDGAVAVALMVLVELDAALQVDRIDHAAVLDDRLRVHADHVLADGQSGARRAPSRWPGLPSCSWRCWSSRCPGMIHG